MDRLRGCALEIPFVRGQKLAKIVILFVFTFVFAFGCSSTKEKELAGRTLVSGHCMQAFEEEYQGTLSKIVDKTKQVVGTTASYLVTGVGHSTDLVLTLSGGIAIAALLCSPVLALEIATEGDGRASGECMGRMAIEVSMKDKMTTLGEKSYSATRSWRCPNLDHVSVGLRKVASCYEKEGDPLKAMAQLKAIREEQIFIECLSAVEFKTVADELERLSN